MADQNFSDWISLGNEWIISYLRVNFRFEEDRAFSYQTHTVERFSAAHAMEQYFKACIVQKHDSDMAMKKSHSIYDMFKELKADPKFLPGLNISQDMYNLYTVEATGYPGADSKLVREIIMVQQILMLFKFTPDLKYQRFKKAKGTIAFVHSSEPDIEYAKIFHQIRTYLGYKSTENDLLLDALTHKDFEDDRAKENFLKVCIYGI